jgi:hypothetical protein
LGVALNRPQVTRLFVGKTPGMVAKTVPLLYSVCSQAQRLAAQAALDGAAHGSSGPVSDSNLWTEMLHESLWRVMLDWPPALGLPAAKEAFVAWRSACHGSHAAAVTEQLVGDLVLDLSKKCLERMPVAEDDCIDEVVPLDPEKWLNSILRNNEPAPALSPPKSIRSAYRARIAQLQRASVALASKAPFPVAFASAQSWGVAQVATARGVLTHAAQVVNGCVTAYRVCAPTDAFFADRSALLAMLQGRTFSSAQDAKSAMGLAVLALDPCVPYETEVSDA